MFNGYRDCLMSGLRVFFLVALDKVLIEIPEIQRGIKHFSKIAHNEQRVFWDRS
jgi:hypothetical protein